MTTPRPVADHTAEHPQRPSEPLLLVGGSGLGPWVWDDFIAHLPTGTAVAVAERPTSDDTSLLDAAECALDAGPDERFTIVAHSLGAIVGLAAAQVAPERVNALVAVAGVIPSAGGSFLSAMPLPNRWILDIAMRLGGTRPPDKAIRNSLAAGLDRSVADRVVERFEPDAPRLFREAIERPDIPQRRGYVTTSRDVELTPKLQQRFADALRPEWTHVLDTGHLPMLEDPAGLADAVLDFAPG